MRVVFAVAFFVLLLSASPTARADTVVDWLDGNCESWDEWLTAWPDTTYQDLDTLGLTPSLPFTASHSSAMTMSSSTASYDFSSVGGVETFSISAVNWATENGQTKVYGWIYFYVDDYTTTYSVTGNYDFGGGEGIGGIRAEVYKLDGGWQTVYDNWQHFGTLDSPHDGTPGTLTVGGTEGVDAFEIGSQTGLVDYDTWYALGFVMSIGSLGDGEMNASGTVTFTLGPTPVPDPCTLGLFGVGIAGLAGMRLRKRRVTLD